jgi:hypothetical protein
VSQPLIRTADGFLFPLRGRVLSWLLGISLALATGASNAKEDEWRWRVLDQEDEALLVISDTHGGDHFGLPLLSCKKNTGAVEVEGEARENLRFAMADLIRADGVPWIQAMPEAASVGDTTLDLHVNMLDGWRYKFLLSADHRAFERFKRSGVIEFKLGAVVVHEEFKVGLESAGKFFDLCKKLEK